MSFLCKARISFVLFVLSLFTCLSDGRGLDEGGGAAGSQISAFNFRTTPKLRKAKSKPSYLSSCNQQMFKFIHYASKVSVIHTLQKALAPTLPISAVHDTTMVLGTVVDNLTSEVMLIGRLGRLGSTPFLVGGR